jgi:glutathione S-transferase
VLIYYDWNESPNCFKTKILLNELGIAYEQRSLSRAELQTSEFRAKFPAGQAPALEDGPILLSESGAIALYLAEKFRGPLPPAPEHRARMLRALFTEAALVAPTLGGQGIFGELMKPEPERDMQRVRNLWPRAQQVAAILSELLGPSDYFAHEFSIADIQLYAATSKAIDKRIFEAPAPNLLSWHARMSARPSVQAAREEYLPYRSHG